MLLHAIDFVIDKKKSKGFRYSLRLCPSVDRSARTHRGLTYRRLICCARPPVRLEGQKAAAAD